MLNNCQIIQRLLDDGALLVDVRTAVEWNQGHLQEAVNIPLETLGYYAENEFEDKRKILLYCRSGQRAEAAKVFLESKGFEAYNIGMAQTYKVCQRKI